MHFWDWFITASCIALVLGVGIFAQRYMKSVADFLSGRRLAGRYLLTVSKGEMQAGAVVFVAMFEMIGEAGFTTSWWLQLQAPVALLVAISGFVIYRYRETRAMTLAQFFELRYSKRFRVFTGCLGFLAGVLNFGIIPSVAARFLVYFWQLPSEFQFLGFTIPTFMALMGIFLGITLFITLVGGLITVMITDCIEGILSQLFYLAIIAALLVMFNWQEIAEALGNRPPGQSMLNPFDSMSLKNFNLWYILIATFTGVYGTMAWQNASAYNAAALNAHESRMSNILGRWRDSGRLAVITLLAVCAFTFLVHPDFTTPSTGANELIAGIENPQVQKQMRIPIALSHLLPIGIKGLLCAVLLMGIVGGDSTHLHSWGGIFVQDVLVPLRKKPFGPTQHIRALRWAIVAVAVFAFLFGSLFKQTEYIFMWWSVTMGIYIGGAGAAIIGGLYWKKGTAAGAWTAMITGSVLSTSGIVARQLIPDFPLNGQQIALVAILTSITLYVVISLLTCREPFNMDRLLHRGAYAKVAAKLGDEPVIEAATKKSLLGRVIGVDGSFTRGDKIVSVGLLIWGLFWFGVMLVGTAWNLIAPWSLATWSTYNHIVGIGIPILMALITGIWFTWGGLKDIRALLRRLRDHAVNHLDDGTVVGHQNLDEVGLARKDAAPRETKSS
ncbi:MAG TPA: sodium:proline symporter [Kiritimatiellia bacterium]|nr:sodium:proline symporter [Kiritimatiellia bacterium]